MSPQGAGSPLRPEAATRGMAVEEMAERLAQTEQLLSQLKMMIREKDATLNSKEEQLKVRHLAKKQADRHCKKAQSNNISMITKMCNYLSCIQTCYCCY